MPAYCQSGRVLSLNDALIETMKHSPVLKKAAESVKTARYNYLSSFSSFLPQVNASVSGTKKSGSDTAGDPNNYSYGVSGSISLFSGFKDISSLMMKDLEITTAEADYKRVLSDTVYDLKKSFIELLWSQETVVLSEEILKQRDNNLQLVSLKYEAGNEDKGSFSRVQADKLQAEYDLAKAKRRVDTAAFDLLRAMGNSEYEAITATGSFSISANYNDFADTLERFFNDSYKKAPEYIKLTESETRQEILDGRFLP